MSQQAEQPEEAGLTAGVPYSQGQPRPAVKLECNGVCALHEDMFCSKRVPSPLKTD